MAEAPRDLLAELDSIKAAAEEQAGREDPADQPTTVTPLSRFEEHYAAFRHSLAQVLDRGDEA